MSNTTTSYPNLQKKALLIGIVGIAIAAFGLFKGVSANDSRPVYSWLIGFTVWYSMSIGMLLTVILLYLFDAGWSTMIRRQIEHALNAIPYLFAVLVPLVAIGWISDNPGVLWKWMDPDLVAPGAHTTVANDPLYQNKAGLLNLPFFTIRILIYFGIYTFVSKRLRHHSFMMDKTGNPIHMVKARWLSGFGAPAVGLCATFAAFDLYMSLSYHWFSTMYGVWFFATSMRAGLAGIMIMCALLATRGHLKGLFLKGHMYNLGCMFLAFTVFWAYISFSQYFLIYSANIPEETFWFNIRELTVNGDKSSWFYLSVLCLIFGYFLIPFLILLFYKTKVVMKRMVFISCWILTFFLCDVYFNILPSKQAADNAFGYVIQQFSINLWDIAAILGVGGIFVWATLKSMAKESPIPLRDPRIEESLHYHG